MKQNKINDIKLNTTNYIKVLGDTQFNKIILFLIENKRTDWSIKEISNYCNITELSVNKIINNLLNYDIVRYVKHKDNKLVNGYKINLKNQIAFSLAELSNSINYYVINKSLKK